MTTKLYKNVSAEGAAFGAIEINQENPWASLNQARQNRLIVQAMAAGMERLSVEQGVEEWCLIVYFETPQTMIRGIVPQRASGFANREEMELAVGRQLAFMVKAVNKEKNFCILSRTEALQRMQEITAKTIKVGDIRAAVVDRVTQYAAFCNVGGIPATLRKEEYSYNFTEDLREVLNVGDELNVKILDIKENTTEDGKKSIKLQVSHKQMYPNPWTSVAERFRVGGLYAGTVTGIADSGSYIRLAHGIDAMAPHPAEGVLERGTQVLVRIQSIEPEKEHINARIWRVN